MWCAATMDREKETARNDYFDPERTGKDRTP